ncbi:hypothetical protein [Okeania sp. SIO2C2]|nr:hypothetical protein [Okeania sp. SIO2C2]
MAIHPYRSQSSGVRSQNMKGSQFKLTIIKIVTTNLGLVYLDISNNKN